jgi:uncharacterized protein YbjT (DUF2867 family)
VRAIAGDVLVPGDVERAVDGQDAVVVALGIRENALGVRLFGSRRTALDVRSRGTANLVEAMRRRRVRRLVAQTTYGVGASRGRLSLQWRLVFSALLAPQIADTERQEDVVRGSGLDWVLVQPVSLTDAAGPEQLLASTDAAIRGWSVSRRAVARVLADAVDRPEWTGQTVAVSAG